MWNKKRPSSDSPLFSEAERNSPRNLISQGVQLTGGDVCAQGGLLIDGQLVGTRTIKTLDASLIRISVLGRVQSTLLECTDLVIDGQAQGVVIMAQGRVAIGSTAVVVGTLLKGPQCELYISPSADVQDLTIKPLNDALRVTRPPQLSEPA